MADNSMGRDRDLVLAPGEFAFVLDTTKGLVNTIVGPNKISMSNTDQPVIWDKDKKRFVRVEAERAIQVNTIAPEGFYIALYNPADNQPREAASSVSVPLKVGHRVNLPGPVNFPLWPGQMASVIQGHHLRSNQYLLAQVYNDGEATANWKSAVLKPQGTDVNVDSAAVAVEPRSFTPGQLIIIKGTEVAFFIPPTGVKVVPETNGAFVREAVTLERLEYCILLDEDGNKRFVQGPDVVFPEPTEQFITQDVDGTMVRKFRAIELNETTGLYIKVIADYTENGVTHKTGDELFITGKEQAIYFQREEHSVIRYGGQTKHYAVAVPAGEGRYVLDRNTGVIALVRGPKMLLCDPRKEVIVRRVLAEKTARLWFPNNEKVVEVNRALEAAMQAENKTQYDASRVMNMMTSNAAQALAAASYTPTSRQVAGDTFTRGTTFTPPRTITLDTKYEGAISISVWTGYAVLVVAKTGARRVVIGPETFLLEYDETLAPLELSTGKPKTDTKLLHTAYLRVHNNSVSDIINVETKDLVHVTLQLSYKVNFEGEPELWFEVENYVQLLCDHMRSMIRNAAKRRTIEEFYSNVIDVIRDTVLGVPPEAGQPRLGQLFVENQMRVYDIEVLDVKIADPSVAKLLADAQTDALTAAITISNEERAFDVTQRLESIKRQTAEVKTTTVLRVNALSRDEIAATLLTSTERVKAEMSVEATKLLEQSNQQAVLDTLSAAEIARRRADDTARIETRRAEIAAELTRLVGESEEITKRAGAVSANLTTALTVFADQALVEKISIALAPMSAMSGVSVAEVLGNLFKGTPLAGVMDALASRSHVLTQSTQ